MAGMTRIEQEQEALRLLRASYWADVRAFAEDIAREAWDALSDDDRLDMVAAGEPSEDLRDRIDEACHEYADGSEWVIYTWRTYIVLLVSDHTNQYEEEAGGVGDHDPAFLDIAVQQAAYYALKADIWAQSLVQANALIEAEAEIEAEAAQNDGQ